MTQLRWSTTFQFVVSLKAAKALGRSISPSIRTRAVATTFTAALESGGPELLIAQSVTSAVRGQSEMGKTPPNRRE
jgi:hypothetical protein